MPSQLSGELAESLDEEIDALKRNRSASTVRLFNGRFLREAGGFNIYLFNLESFLAALDDSPAEIDISGQRHSAQVLLTQGLEVELGVERFLGKFVPTATLYTNSWYLLELLKRKLSEEHSGAKGLDFTLSEGLLLGTLLQSRPSQPVQADYSLGQEPPNDAQKQAIEDSFSSRLSVVWGPPGTGKTRTVAKAVEAHLNAGRSVLLVSHANNAVDEALEDIAEHLRGSPFYQEGKLVRLGTPQHEHHKILESRYELVLLDKIAERLGETLSQERRTLEAEKARIDDAITDIGGAVRILAMARALCSELDGLGDSLSQVEGRLRETRAKLAKVDETRDRDARRLEEAQSAGAMKRLLTGLNPSRIQHDMDQAAIRRGSLLRALEADVELRASVESAAEAKESDWQETRARADALLQGMGIPEEQLDERDRRYGARRDAILARIAEINRELEEIQNRILAEARLVATTLTKTFTANQFPNRQFDVLILDEASMAPLPHLYWATGRCSGFVTVVGDFLQLPPICVSEKPMARKWLGRSIFDVLGIRTPREAREDKRVTLLDTQYRMVPAISEVSNRFIYQGILRDHQSTSREDLNDGTSTAPLVLIETGRVNAWCSQISTGGRFNLHHALVSATLARRIVQQVTDCRVGIVTPYRHQARLINKIAKDWQLTDRVRISTIHTFQGGERQTIIFDTTEGVGLRTAPMLDDTKRDSDALRVLNVAVTRARDKLYLVANTKRLLAELGSESLLSRILHHFEERAECLESASLVDDYFATDFDRWAGELLGAPRTDGEPVSGELYTERNFWAQFLHDIGGVQQRLMILSPFMSVNRAGKLMDYFKAMIERGVDVRVYTRPANQQSGEMAGQSATVLTQLRAIGASAIERRNMHQKVAVLDDSIAWEGSLNILSHRDSGEQMRRFVSQSAVEDISRNLELDEKHAVGVQTSEQCPGPDGGGCEHDGYLIVRRNRRRGTRFLGCSAFPKCKYTEPLRQAG